MDGHGRVAQHRLGPRGGDRHVRRLARLRVDHRIAEMPEVAGDGFVKDFVVADGRLQERIPIDQPLAAVDQAVAKHVEKRVRGPPGRRSASSVKRVRCQSQLQPICLSWPRMRASYSFFQVQMRSTSAVAAQVVPGFLFFLQQPPLDDRLGGDAGMIGARHPQRVEALHPLPADQDVLQRIVQGVPQVQGAGDVRRRDDDACRACGRRSGSAVKVSLLLPEADTSALGPAAWSYCLGSSGVSRYLLGHATPIALGVRLIASVELTPSRLSRLPSAAFVLVQLVFEAVDQGDPTGLDHVFADADRAPDVVLVAAFDHHADPAAVPASELITRTL